MGTKIYNLPAPNMLKQFDPLGLNSQTPTRGLVIISFAWQAYTFEQLQDMVAELAGLNPKTTYAALGVRACDSARRALFFKKHGPITKSRRKFYPVWDWNKEKAISELKRHDIKLPIDYKMFGRTFDGTYYMYTAAIKKFFPEDYKHLLEYYPLIDKHMYRHEKRTKMGY